MWTAKYILAALAVAATAQGQSLLSALNSTSQLSSFYSLLTPHPALVSKLAGLSNITILAPSNQALSNFASSSGAISNSSLSEALLAYHILNGSYQSFGAGPLFISTFLEPSAFSDVVGGQRVQVNNNTVTSGNKQVSNITTQTLNFTGGVIHVIDKVLTIPESFSNTIQEFNLTVTAGIIRHLKRDYGFDRSSQFTVFVPSNNAWIRIGNILPNLTLASLTNVLSYHIVNTSVLYTPSLTTNESIRTVNGQNVTVTKNNESSIYINQARVVIPNIFFRDGVMHIIDDILNPDNQTRPSGNPGGGVAFAGATSLASISYTDGVAGPTSSLNTASIQATATAAASSGSSGSSGSSSSSSGAAWVPRATGAIQAAVVGGLALALL